MAAYWPTDQGGCLTACLPSLQLLAEKPGQFMCQPASFPLSMAAQNMACRFRAIAPRPAVPLDGSLESASPSSSTDNSIDTNQPHETAVSGMKRGKRPASSRAPALRAAKRRSGVTSPLASLTPAKPSLPVKELPLRPAARSPAEVLQEFRALDATPLGKLLRAMPDVKVGGATITWGTSGPGILPAEIPGSVVSTPSSSAPPSPLCSRLEGGHGETPSPIPPLPRFMFSPVTSCSKQIDVGKVATGGAAVAGVQGGEVATPRLPSSQSSNSASRFAGTPGRRRGGALVADVGATTTPVKSLPPVASSVAASHAPSHESSQQQQQQVVPACHEGGKTAVGALRRTARPPVVLNVDDMEHTYGTPTEAAMLTDEEHRLLWANNAFKRAAAEAVAAGESGRHPLSDARPDALAFPVPVSSVLFQPAEGRQPCKAILWAFLKQRGSAQTTVEARAEARAKARAQAWGEGEDLGREKGWPRADSIQVSHGTGPQTALMAGDLLGSEGGVGSRAPSPAAATWDSESGQVRERRHRVICPKAVRSVGSCIRVESVRQVAGPHAAPLRGTFDLVHRQFDPVERCHSPVVLTDVRGRVRWVNTAYKLLIGQPKCAWLASATGRDGHLSASRLTGEVTMVGLGEGTLAKLGATAVALVCTAEVSWASGGGTASVRLPATATQLVSPGEGSQPLGLVWHLDTAAAGLQLRDGA